MKKYYSNGKLLLTGEYVILDGAAGLALPTQFGQSLEINPTSNGFISWTSLDHKNKSWFTAEFELKDQEITCNSSSDEEVASRLLSLLNHAHSLNPGFLKTHPGLEMQTKLDFPQNWGLGSSSTLVNNLAQCFEVSPFKLLEDSFGGSGYDIAAAQHDSPIVYTRSPEGPKVLATFFNPAYEEDLFFVHLNQKQNSRSSITHYRKQEKAALQHAIDKITGITHQILSAKHLEEFELLLNIHEQVISQLVKLPKIKTRLFPDYPRSIKSLGGWGGDFILATGGEKERAYFKAKGYHTQLSYSEMLKAKKA